MMGAANHNVPPTDCSDWSKNGHVTHTGPIRALPGIMSHPLTAVIGLKMGMWSPLGQSELSLGFLLWGWMKASSFVP